MRSGDVGVEFRPVLTVEISLDGVRLVNDKLGGDKNMVMWHNGNPGGFDHVY